MPLQAQFHSLNDVRQAIDQLDNRLLALLAERGACVRQAARFKNHSDDIPAPQRVAEILERIRCQAESVGLPPAVAEAVWRAMIGAFIEHERAVHAELHPPSSPK